MRWFLQTKREIKVSILNFGKFLRNFKFLTMKGLLENNVLYYILVEILIKIWYTKKCIIWKKHQKIILEKILRKIWHITEKFLGIFIKKFLKKCYVVSIVWKEIMEKILFNFEGKIWLSIKNFEQILITKWRVNFIVKFLNLNKTLKIWTSFE